MATGIFFVTSEDLKQWADDFGLERKERTKFSREEWRRNEDAKLEKNHFEMEAEQKQLKSEAKQKRFESEVVKKRREKERKMIEN